MSYRFRQVTPVAVALIVDGRLLGMNVNVRGRRRIDLTNICATYGRTAVRYLRLPEPWQPGRSGRTILEWQADQDDAAKCPDDAVRKYQP